MTVHEALVGARNYLVQYGWKRGWGHHRGDPTCLVGAINLASKPTELDPYPLLGDLVFIESCTTALGFDEPNDAITWNDQTTSSEILSALDKAIAATAPDPIPVEQLQSNHEFEL